MNQVYFYTTRQADGTYTFTRLNPFMNQVYFYITRRRVNHVLRQGLNPFMNQVYFYRCPSEAAPGAGLRACLRELSPHGGKKVATGLLVFL